jgi:hypothetical protein
VRFAAIVLAALVLAPAAFADATVTVAPTTVTVTTTTTNPFSTGAVGRQRARRSQTEVINSFLAVSKVHNWLKRYPPRPKLQTNASYDANSGSWTVQVWYTPAGEIATGKVDDLTGSVTEAWTGPQVAWKMARGYPGAFGGTRINSYRIWLAFCAVFLIGLVDWRRPLTVRNLDLLFLLSFSVSLWFFNRGNIFAAMPFAYPGMVWLAIRLLWVGATDRRPRGSAVWPVWVLAAATVFLAGFRVGLNVRASNVIDVGYSGVIGADRIVHGEKVYGNFPQEDSLQPCGPADSEGEIRDRIQANGKCETANPLGDTYGPVSYMAYVPGYLIFGWSHHWDTLPAVHFTSIAFDLLAIFGLALVGWRLGGPRVGAAAAFAWAAWPFTQYASSSNTNDAIMPALLVLGFAALTSDSARGIAVALGGWTKFASLLVVPLWLGYPDARNLRSVGRMLAAFALTTIAVFLIVLLHWPPWDSVRTFYDRTVGFQFGRASPFSLWDWGQYHAKGLPDLRIVQRVLEVALVVGALVLGWFPRYRSPLRLAAFSGLLIVGFELVLTHWFYLYLPWFFPFVVLALVAPVPGGPSGPPRELEPSPVAA